jgi:hypothetical protein
MRRAFAIVIAWGGLALAGQGWAGEGMEAAPSGAVSAQGVAGDLPAGPVAASTSAWVATYSLREHGGDRTLVVVRTDDRVEYRMQGEPVRTWHRLADGVEYRELHFQDGRVVVYAPGDLRALGHDPDWRELHDLVAPAERASLQPHGSARAEARTVQHFQGDFAGIRITLDWLEEAALPARYVRGTGRGATTLALRKLDRVAATTAFTATDGLREIDYTDLGDMALDAFASRHIHQGFQTH